MDFFGIVPHEVRNNIVFREFVKESVRRSVLEQPDAYLSLEPMLDQLCEAGTALDTLDALCEFVTEVDARPQEMARQALEFVAGST